ncbi:MAG: DUF4159 domain-containing protein, partial [Proteobacteria bacterium]|nr:DUF4159 domain-containing protein [Pseudomonadota bacterium]
VDDFWGKAEWDSLERAMEEVFPENRWRAIPNDHPILQSPFKLANCPQVPARDFASPVQHYDPPGIHKWPTGGDAGVNTVNFRGWFDDEDRLMMVATHNTDIGDGWEREAEGEWYFQPFSTTSYAMGINIIVYAMTH